VQASVGIGLSLIAAPVLMLIDRALVPGPLLTSSIVLGVLMALRDRDAIDTYHLRWALLGRVAGTIPAAWLLTVISARSFDLFFGVVVILGVGLSLIHPRLRPTPRLVVTAGGLSGLMGTISGVGGPPLAILYQHSPPAELRGTMSTFFVVGCSVSVGMLAVAGLYGPSEMLLSLALIPGIVVGFTLSRFTVRLLGGGAVRPTIVVLSLAASGVVLARAFS
jgi:hypothetical protein